MSKVPMTRRGTVKKSFTGTRLIEVMAGDEPANDALAPAVWPMPAGGPIKAFRDLHEEVQAECRAIVRGAHSICNECETVQHCVVHGCIPKVPLTEEQLAKGDLENHHLKVSGEFERRRDQRALELQANMPKWWL